MLAQSLLNSLKELSLWSGLTAGLVQLLEPETSSVSGEAGEEFDVFAAGFLGVPAAPFLGVAAFLGELFSISLMSCKTGSLSSGLISDQPSRSLGSCLFKIYSLLN